MIGFETQILSAGFSMGDYCQLHNGGLHTGYERLSIGHNCWIGQDSILNCTEQLTIGNNVRIGTQSQLWTHVASGELLEGCTLFGQTPLVLEDNVWLVGGAVISPGLILRRNSIVMTGSVLTKSTEPFHTYAGIPARDVTDKLNFWKPQSLDDKVERLRGYLAEFLDNFPQHQGRIDLADGQQAVAAAGKGDVLFLPIVEDWTEAEGRGVSLFDLTTKTYLKQRSTVEIDWIRWSVGYRARFLPREV
jgi:acetyltransferase-like isoleucine patch superfamily enzyme